MRVKKTKKDKTNKPTPETEKKQITDGSEVTEEKELSVVEEKEKGVTVTEEKGKRKGKRQKKEKPLKLPKLFTKKFSKRRLQRKILKKLYIPSDREFVNSFFVQEESDNPKKPGKYYIPQEIHFSKPDLRRLRSLAKQIKKQKGRIKLLPLIAAFSLIFAIVFFIVTMKDKLIAKGIKSFFEYQFEAQCDMASVKLKLLDSSFTIRGFEIANKDKPMENIFSFDSLIIDFDLRQLLKARVIAEELSLNGMDSGTKRSYNGTLPKYQLDKIRAKKEAKAKKAQANKDKINKALTNATNQVKDNITDSIVEIFDTFNPQTILESCYSQFETPDVAENIKEESKIMIDKWGKTPEIINTQVENVRKSAEDIINFDYNSIKNDPKLIKDMLKNFDGAFKTLDGVKVETENLLAQIEDDVYLVNDLLVDIQDSVMHDIGVGRDKIDELKSFRLPSGQEFLASTIDIYGYELLGKYYPKAKQLLAYLVSLKDKQRPKKVVVEKPEEKKGVKRAPGRDIAFVSDRYPKFWIKKIAASGFNMEAQITNITNNMNITNKPSEGVFTFKYKDITHGGKITVDIRTETQNPLVYLEYTCDGTSFSHSDGIPGIPQISSSADYLCHAKIYDDRPFVLTGVGNFYNLDLSTPYFEPSYVHDIYNSILGRFDTAQVMLELEIDGVDNVDLHAYSDLDTKIANAFKDEINLRLTEIKEALEEEISAKIKIIEEKAKVITDKVYEIEAKVKDLENQLYEIEDRLKEKQRQLQDNLEALQTHIENKIIETNQQIQEGLQNKADEIKDKLEAEQEAAKKRREEKAEKFEENLKKGVEDAASNALNNLFGGLKKR